MSGGYVIKTVGEAWELAHAGAVDAANRQMRAAGRSKWNQDDRDFHTGKLLSMLTSMGFRNDDGVPTSLYFVMREDRSAPYILGNAPTDARPSDEVRGKAA
ncbi:hypothetical protein [Sphingomonas japonica]|uniref:Uncharacterized protein n=1 Tax=Sphingomonas japonica TaxID=511662 RepID=A0ABX0U2L5_9SPHN|nr:hypothetical protein [Sphingomonas japonica]NIJ24809.1 hypothetical protein [Sphingomonas japonica]